MLSTLKYFFYWELINLEVKIILPFIVTSLNEI